MRIVNEYKENDVLHQTVLPDKILLSKNAENADSLLSEKPLQICIEESSFTLLHTHGKLLLDFGCELRASVRILTSRISGKGRVRIRYGESAAEAMARLGKKNSKNAHAPRDFTIRLPKWSDVTMTESGFRFVCIELLSIGNIQIKSIVAENKILDKVSVYLYKGTESIENVFNTAKRTIDLCAAGKYVWDGIKRDRLVWIGDIYPEMLALTTLYGRTQQIERSLEFMPATTADGKWMNGIVTYSMWWIITLADYVKRTGCAEFAEGLLPQVNKIADKLLSCVATDGSTAYNGRVLVDWPTSGTVDEEVGVICIHLLCCNKAIELLSRYGSDCSLWRDMRERLMKNELCVKKSKVVASLKYAAGLSLSNDEKNLIKGTVGTSTYMSYFTLTAAAELFGIDTARNTMLEYYGGMLSRGATSFWEDFDIAWLDGSGRIDVLPKKSEWDIHGDYGAYCYVGFRHSLCHGWSAGVITFIEEQLSK